MRKFFPILTLLLVFSQTLLADASCWFGTGWRADSLKWSISGFNRNPNVLSELEWNNIYMWEVSAGIGGEAYECMYYRFTGDYSKIYSGKNIDSDYNLNNREGLYSRSENQANRGEAFDISIGIGYPIHYMNNQLRITPLIGYSYAEQHLTMHDGNQTFSDDPAFIGPFPNLNSTYKTEWSTVWAGFDVIYHLTCDWKMFGTFEFHVADYYARGHWNLRSDFLDDFTHKGWGNGPMVLVGADYLLDRNMSLALTASYQYFRIKDGTDRTKFLLDGIPTEARMHLNEVIWTSFRLLGYLTYVF